MSSTPGFKVLLLGAPGSGKTHSIRTLVDCGLEVFVLFTENGMSGLSDIPSDKLHWHYIPPVAQSFASMLDTAKKLNTLSLEMVAKMSDINRGSHKEFLSLMESCCDFPDDRTGKRFGPIDSFDNSRVVVLDSLSGLSTMAISMLVGDKTMKSPADWGNGQQVVLSLAQKFCTDLTAHFVLLSHIARETDEITGANLITSSTLGRKLAPQLPIWFTDVILTKREGTTWSWSTVENGADLKARHLSWAQKQPPSFVPLFEKWRGEQA